MTATHNTRRWHTNLLLVLTAIWALSSAVGVVWTLATAPAGMFGLVDYYVFLSVPILLAAGAYFLFIQSALRVIPFALLPLAYFLGALRLYPTAIGFSGWKTVAGYVGQFPVTLWGSALFFALCAVYCLFLNRLQSSERPGT